MGSRMARRLLEAGHELVVWNRDPAKAEALVQAGAQAVATPAEAARGADAVVIMVSDPTALREVTEGAAGVAAGATEPAVIVQMATVGPAAIGQLARALPDGVALVDAPVLGSLPEAEAGTLRIFAGGESAVVERLSPVFSALGSLIQVGEVGAGSAAKLVANSTLFGALGVLGEALALAEGLGLTRDVAFDILAVTPIAAQAERRRLAIESGEYPPRFSLALARKDADLVLDAADATGTDMRVGKAARDWLADAEEAGRGDDDYAVALEQMRKPGGAGG